MLQSDSLTLFRRHFAGLPFQLSHYDRCGDAAAYLHLADYLSGGRLNVRFDEDGHLWLDLRQMDTLRTEVGKRLNTAYLETIRTDHERRWDSLRHFTDASPTPGSTELPARLKETGDAVAALAPYALVTKILPDILRSKLEGCGTKFGLNTATLELGLSDQIQPARSIELARALHAVHHRLVDLGCDIRRCRREWPNVPSPVRQAVETFSREYADFGPRAWEAPGYESPEHVLQAMEAHFGQTIPSRRVLTPGPEASAGNPGQRFVPENRCSTTIPSHRVLTPEGLLRSWIEHLVYWKRYIEIQTGTLRAAFHRAMLPALRVLASRWVADGFLSRPTDILFLTRHEIHGGPQSRWVELIEPRRDRYFTNLPNSDYSYLPADTLDRLMKGTG